MGVSVVVPVFNEEENIQDVFESLVKVLSGMGEDYEIIFVDDGSVDGTYQSLKKISEENSKFKVIKLARNFGQSAALAAGIQESNEDYIITMDGDMQNDPKDIPALLKKVHEGFAAVCGWRRKRRDNILFRKFPSRIANYLISKFSGQLLHDHGCTLRAYRAKWLRSILLYGEQHRYIPALIAREGGKVCEIEVNHFPRTKGVSKYGIDRVFRVSLDLLSLKFFLGFSSRPIHFFGYFGLVLIFFSGLVGLNVLWSRFIIGIPGINLIPLILLVMFFLVIGTQVILFGVLAEITIRSHHESQGKPFYRIEEKINF